MTKETLTAVIHKEENLYVALCPEVGTASQGKTVEDALLNLKEATEMHLEEFPMPKVDRSLGTPSNVCMSTRQNCRSLCVSLHMYHQKLQVLQQYQHKYQTYLRVVQLTFARESEEAADAPANRSISALTVDWNPSNIGSSARRSG